MVGIIDIGENFALIHSDLMCHKILFMKELSRDKLTKLYATAKLNTDTQVQAIFGSCGSDDVNYL